MIRVVRYMSWQERRLNASISSRGDVCARLNNTKELIMTSRERVRKTIRFEGADRLPYDLPAKYGSDFALAVMAPYVDMLLPEGTDEWGAVWESVGNTNLGQVKEFPLKDWKDFDKLTIPDIRDPKRWESIEGVREFVGDKFLLTMGISLFERPACDRAVRRSGSRWVYVPGRLGSAKQSDDIAGCVAQNLET